VVINASDFDPDLYRRPDGVEPVATPATPATQASIPTREDIREMRKGEVREWLEAHGAEVPKGRSIVEMRADLETLIYLDI
jgi:hypothetical protein